MTVVLSVSGSPLTVRETMLKASEMEAMTPGKTSREAEHRAMRSGTEKPGMMRNIPLMAGNKR